MNHDPELVQRLDYSKYNPFILTLALLPCLLLGRCAETSPAYADQNYAYDSLMIKAELSAYETEVSTEDMIKLIPIQMVEPTMIDPNPIIVNKYFNQFEYQAEPPDADHWKTLQEFIADGGGDCEDFAIAKYHALKGKYNVKILTGARFHRGTFQGHAVVLLDDSLILDINYPYVYSYREYLETWTPIKTYDDKGVQDVLIPQD